MKTLIVCFSQTGNTRTIAERIQRGIIETGSICDLVGLKDVATSSLSDYDLIGIGAPVFYYQEPFNVRDFIEALPEREGQHWFVFCTHANIIGNFFPSVADPPRIQTPCIYCWRCVTICPTLSVEADWEPLVAMAPQNYARYKKELDRVAANGDFRWLIDPESIVFDDPLYKQRQRHVRDSAKAGREK
jgi:ferredoxin